MELKEFRFSLLMLGWEVKIDNEDSMFWEKGGQTIQWDKDQEDPLFKQIIFHEILDSEAGYKKTLVKKGGTPFLSHAYSSFAECIREVSK